MPTMNKSLWERILTRAFFNFKFAHDWGFLYN